IHLGRQTIDRLQKCRLIVRCGVGYDNVDYRYARQKGIPVANVPDYGTEEVADSAIALMLSLVRGVTYHTRRLQQGDKGAWHYRPPWPLFRLRGRNYASLGLGRIGIAAALRAKAFGMQVLFYDPYVADGIDKALGFTRVETLDELLQQAFVLSIYCPLTEETRHLIDARALALLPDGAYLVNTARGGIVDTTALLEALRRGKLAGVGLDVLPKEPPSDDDPLIQAWRNPDDPCHDRLIINPHSAFYSEEGLRDMRLKGARNCRRALLGQPLRNVVN
ncbi:MAG: C-terminal binding protein, partial [Gemmataceae bacterium]|nr:C-terminal binding protein [Gemmataceae bacterium]